MHSVRFINETSAGGVVERDFLVDDVPGVLWAPVSGADHAPVVLLGHNGGMHKKAPGLRARALHAAATWGFNVVAIDAPGHGDRPRTTEDEQARTEIRQAVTAGDTPRFAAASVRLTASLAERAVREWQMTLDALQALPRIGPDAPVGYGGGISMGTAIGVRLAAAEPRIAAAIFGGGFFVDEPVLTAARQITVPVQFLLPWDDQHVERSSGLALFDAFASAEKTLHANAGDHRGARWVGVDDTFLARHLGRA
ncbi:alpha/beta hydrolase [Micromonospora sp. CPCC 205561]|uniref:alpha/beta hydrolase n=1 Tax=Micromonospora sp. CPCC 205561 TaxID=3122407 RepID=UPI002FF1E0BA